MNIMYLYYHVHFFYFHVKANCWVQVRLSFDTLQNQQLKTEKGKLWHKLLQLKETHGQTRTILRVEFT